MFYVYAVQYTESCMLYQIVGIRASDNNRASTVLDLFLESVDQYGAPSRVRGDRGMENKLVAIWMIQKWGLNRGSFIWGTYVCYQHVQTRVHNLQIYT